MVGSQPPFVNAGPDASGTNAQGHTSASRLPREVHRLFDVPNEIKGHHDPVQPASFAPPQHRRAYHQMYRGRHVVAHELHENVDRYY